MDIKIPTPKLIDIKKVKRNPNNVKIHSEAQIIGIAELIKLVGFKDPIVLDEDLMCWAGDGRLSAAEYLGMKKIPWVPLEDLTEEQKKAFMIMDNKIAESPWNIDNLQSTLEEIPNFNFDSFSISFDDMNELYVEKPLKEETAEVPPEPKRPRAKRGDIYQLGPHRIMCGDSANPGDIKKLMSSHKAMMGFTDPPYGVKYEQGKYTGIKVKKRFQAIENDEKQGQHLQQFIKGVFEAWKNYLQGATIYVCSPSMIPSLMILQGLMTAGYHMQSQIIWAKNQFILGRGDYHWQHEIIWYGYEANPHYWCGDRRQSTLWKIKKDAHANYNHPTQKPVELSRRAIKNSSRRKNLVVDMFLGSGATLIACEQLDRACYSMEIEPVYVDVSIKRWENYTHKKAKKLT